VYFLTFAAAYSRSDDWWLVLMSWEKKYWLISSDCIVKLCTETG
jgi:hypothetical protein